MPFHLQNPNCCHYSYTLCFPRHVKINCSSGSGYSGTQQYNVYGTITARLEQLQENISLIIDTLSSVAIPFCQERQSERIVQIFAFSSWFFLFFPDFFLIFPDFWQIFALSGVALFPPLPLYLLRHWIHCKWMFLPLRSNHTYWVVSKTRTSLFYSWLWLVTWFLFTEPFSTSITKTI